MLAVAPNSSFKTVAELIGDAKKNPGKLSNASSSNGSPGHVGGELFKYMTGTEIVHVPYKGGAPAINDLIAGHVELMFESINSIAPHVPPARCVRWRTGSGARRFPDVPTSPKRRARLRSDDLERRHRPAGMPRPIVDKLNAAVNAPSTPKFKERFAATATSRRRHTGGVRRADPQGLGEVEGSGAAVRSAI